MNIIGASADANPVCRGPRTRRWLGVAGVDLVIAGVRVKGLDVRLNLLALDGLASRRYFLKLISATLDGALLLMVLPFAGLFSKIRRRLLAVKAVYSL